MIPHVPQLLRRDEVKSRVDVLADEGFADGEPVIATDGAARRSNVPAGALQLPDKLTVNPPRSGSDL